MRLRDRENNNTQNQGPQDDQNQSAFHKRKQALAQAQSAPKKTPDNKSGAGDDGGEDDYIKKIKSTLGKLRKEKPAAGNAGNAGSSGYSENKRNAKARGKEESDEESGSTVGPFLCHMCNDGVNLKSESGLKRHLKSKHDVHEDYACQYPGCNSSFQDQGKLKRHNIVHTGEKPYKCDICGRDFGLEYNMKLHKRTHSGERPYACEIPGCDKRFGQKSNLKIHMTTSHKHLVTNEMLEHVEKANEDYYLQKQIQEAQNQSPIFKIMRSKQSLANDPNNDAPIYLFSNQYDLHPLSEKEYLVELIKDLRCDLAPERRKSFCHDEMQRMEEILTTEYEQEYLQILSYQGLLAKIFWLQQMMNEADKINVIYTDKSRKFQEKSKQVLGIAKFPDAGDCGEVKSEQSKTGQQNSAERNAQQADMLAKNSKFAYKSDPVKHEN